MWLLVRRRGRRAALRPGEEEGGKGGANEAGQRQAGRPKGRMEICMEGGGWMQRGERFKRLRGSICCGATRRAGGCSCGARCADAHAAVSAPRRASQRRSRAAAQCPKKSCWPGGD